MFQVLFVPCSEAWKSFVLCYGMRPMSKLAHEVAVRPDLRIGIRPQLPRGFSLPAEALRLGAKCIMCGIASIIRYLPHGGKGELLKCVLAGIPRLLKGALARARNLPAKGSRQLLDTTLKARSSTARSTKSMDSLHMKRKELMGLKLHFAMQLTTTLTLAGNLA
jgi:hypothetical protein